MRLYFAYGSNLSLAQMKSRCPGSERIGHASLSNYRWGISSRGYANVYKSDGDIVYGIVYSLTPSDEQMLDRYEGVRSGAYEKFDLDLNLLDLDWKEDRVDKALVYIDPRQGEGVPRKEYIGRMRIGLKDAQLPEEWVKKWIEPVLGGEEVWDS